MIALALMLAAAGQNEQARVPITPPERQAGTDTSGQPAAHLVIEPAAMAIATFDSDGDGRTSRAELQAGVHRSFEAIDTAHAGKLRYLDFAEWALRWLGDRTALPSPFDVDSDGDNAVSLPELQAAFAAIFDRLDKDHDGFVTRAELLTIRANVSSDRSASGHKGKHPH